ncbi:MAG TPA: HAMP domain-containing methyl-accepting chemotaxis protein [Longimicrobiales bacterium]|nr:HAMP domain-containing methyl-accepting chemotaxis protein [Longimicrobiales bacterium]
MNGIRAYFDRIQGRLLAALAPGALAMLVLFVVSTNNARRFSDQIADDVMAVQERVNTASRLEGAISDQVNAAQQYLMGRDPAALDSALRHAAEAQGLQSLMLGDENVSALARSQLGNIRNEHIESIRVLESARDDIAAGAAAQAAEAVRSIEPVLRVVRARIRGVTLAELETLTTQTDGFGEQVAAQERNLAIILVVSLLISLLFAKLTLRAIERPLSGLVLAANQFGTGDLNVSVNGRMPDEFRVLAGAFTGMADRIRSVVGETVATANRIGQSAADLSSISEEVAASSGEVSTAMIGITNGAEEQAFGLGTVDQALEKMREGASQIEDSSRRVVELSSQIGDLATTKRQDIGSALAMLLELREVVRVSAKEVRSLERASEKISTFVGTIQGVARQTNLLALNAAIEAARAGEHGRGFAVVADEVRKLADGSARAAHEVDATVSQIREQIDAFIATMETGFSRVTGVEETSRGAEAAFEEILAAVEQVAEAAHRVVQSAETNRSAFETVEDAVRNVGAAAESHAASAQEVSAAAEEQSAATQEMSAASVELLMSADRLKELVAGFKV